MWRRTPPDVYREVFQAAPDAILLVAADGTITDANRRAGELFGWALEDLLGQPVEVLVPAEDRDRHRRHREHYAEGPRPRPMGRNLQLWGVRRDGSSFPIDVSLSPVSSPSGGLVAAAVRDVTERVAAADRLQHLATHDPLTGMANRALALDRLEHALEHARRYGDHVGVLFVDLDGFKDVNDRLGHTVGDAVLIEVGRRIGEDLRRADTAARFGGDEFLVVCPDLPADRRAAAAEADRLRTRLLHALSQPLAIDDLQVPSSASIGLVIGGPGGESADDLIRRADRAMYRHKASRRTMVLAEQAEAPAAEPVQPV